MEKILGIDTGTNSLGWAIVEKSSEGCRLLDKGVHIFQEGVNIEKGIESSKAADRTGHRATRVRYYRIRMRKIELLKILIDNHLCPPISKDDLKNWKLKKIYPKNELFMHWQRTNDNEGKNPYADRHKCLHEKLDLDNLMNRYTLGRAFYHLIQRRGFLSNRKEQGGDDTGAVKEGISVLSEEMRNAGFEYLGDYFYSLYNKGEKIRDHYTARNEHYLKEFKAICEKQELDSRLGSDVVKAIEKAIFYQRPLKSQKGQVGKCVFEKNKAKCPVSHPLFEEFRMLQFLNNVKIQTPKDEALRPLNNDEREKVKPLFFRKKRNFDFKDIAKKLAPKEMYAFYKENPDMPYLFNYPMDVSVSGCVVTAYLRDIFGEDWLTGVCEVYTLAEGKTRMQILNDVWHALFFYSDKEKLEEFAKERLQLSDDDAKKFSEIPMPSEYASLSLKAINKILPYLRRGMIYSRAVFLGNLCKVMPQDEWTITEMREAAIEKIVKEMDNFNPNIDNRTLEICLKDYLKYEYGVTDEGMKKLYHPSMMETYPPVRPNSDGLYQLGSPRINSVRNPMAMRSMFRLRKLINRLLQEGKIDKNTTINIEFARELNDANKRKAIADNVRENQRQRDDARNRIIELYKTETGKEIVPNEDDILKYILWEKEQDHVCLYTGKQIGIADFIGSNPKYDIEHTVPQSVGGDSTRMNLTLCDSRYNREVKKAQLPSELYNHDEILKRIEPWKKKYEDLDKQIRRLRTGGASTKDTKDKIIQRRHLLQLKRDYWRGKYERFTMTEVPEGFSRRQGTDISVISKYARLYLKSIFDKVYTVKGIATSDFRKIWGIQDVYASKERVNHVHHCIDAIVIACIGKAEYDKLAQYYHDKENHEWYGFSKADFVKPWPTFVEDIKKVQNEILVSHYTPDNMSKQGRKHTIANGKKVLSKGDAARGSLHKDTYYGAIERDGNIKYVVRRELASLDEKDIKYIVDDTVRGIVETAIAEKGFKEAMTGTIWMNEEKQIPIKKIRCYTSSVTNPLNIRKHRDESVKEYKRQFHVLTGGNYLIASYVGTNAKGSKKTFCEFVNMLDAAKYFRTSNNKEVRNYSIVQKEKKGCKLAYILKKGTMVLFYENEKEEVWEYSAESLSKNLYYVSVIESDGRVTFKYHQEARIDKEIPRDTGKEPRAPKKRISLASARILVQGYDFDINELGEIKRLR